MIIFGKIALRRNRTRNPRLLSLILHFNPPYRLEFPVFGVGLYRGVPVHQSYTGCGHDYGRLVYSPEQNLVSPLFVPSGFSEVEFEKNRFEVHQFSNSGSCVPIFRSFHSVVREKSEEHTHTQTHKHTNKLSLLLLYLGLVF